VARDGWCAESALRAAAEAERGAARVEAEAYAARAGQAEEQLEDVQQRLGGAEASQAEAELATTRLQAALDEQATAAEAAASMAEKEQNTLAYGAGALLTMLAWSTEMQSAEEVRPAG
jgi:hypothetical protein